MPEPLFLSQTQKRSSQRRIGSDLHRMVEHRGFEPLTSTMRTLRATNCANAPRMIGGFMADLR